MGLKARDPPISHALRPPAPAALTAKAPTSAPSGVEGGATLTVAADPTNLLTDLSLADVQRLVATVDAAARSALGATVTAPRLAATPGRAGPIRGPWAWLWAAWEGAASLYVALTEPKRRDSRGRAG